MRAVSREQSSGDFSARMPLDWVGINGKITDTLNDIIRRKVITMYLIRLASRFLLPFLLLAATVAVAAEKEVYILSVVPQLTASETHRSWTPIVEKLSRATGRQIELRLYPNFTKFEAAIQSGESDLAYINPFHMVMAKRAQGYLPLLRDDSNQLFGILVVQRNSPIKSIQELNGKEIGFSSPNAFGASLYLRALLAEQEKIRITPRYVQTQGNVYRGVIIGDIVAGGAINNTFKRELPELQSQLRILFETPKFSPHPLVAHPRVPEAIRLAVTNALLEMQNDPAGQKLLAAIQVSKPVKADYARDYQALEKLKLENYAVIEKD